jgi:hypothetical protein
MNATVKLNGMRIQMAMKVPQDCVFEVGIDREFDAGDIAAVMDMLTDVAARETLKQELAAKRELLRSNRERLATKEFDQQLAALKEATTRELDELRENRDVFDRSISERWASSERRGARRLTGPQQTKLAEFDKLIAEKLAEFDIKTKQNREAKREVEKGIPLTEWQIDCLYARISGQPEPAMPEEVRTIVEKLDMPARPEDVGFSLEQQEAA